ncbi:protein mono-ADP-ribosyltransferase TIPARP-like [Myripristis murdjan]|uniref:protein mono-ADP-ribosyltransferase TIPARP-like n=1 Tax=Myripristis murdjan TaxID=586833 RepID=UPI0011761B99|nr:protein mono-ADP-ribosyltransferase TIPARP-like [Myripristis murdjan]
MTDHSSSKGQRRKRAAHVPAPQPAPKSPKVAFLSPSLLLLEIPADSNTSLPVWDALRSQQVDVAWAVNPYSINLLLTPVPSKQGTTTSPGKDDSTTNMAQMSAAPSSVMQPQMIIQSLAQQDATTQNTSNILLSFSQNVPSLLPRPGPCGQTQNVMSSAVSTTSLVVPLPLIITQSPPALQPSTPAKNGAPCFTRTPTTSPTKPPVQLKPRVSRPFHTKSSDDISICDRFLLSVCHKGAKCKMHHTPYPFHWQLWCVSTHKWVDFPARSQLLLERVYCDVNSETVSIKDGNDLFKLDFESMELDSPCKYDGVRRLSNTDDPAKNPHFPSKWKIYWWDNLNWLEYKEDVAKNLLEKMNEKEAECFFNIGSKQYRVDFISMTQTNITTGFQREIRRRPAYLPRAAMEPYLKTGVLTGSTQALAESPAANFSVDPLQEFSCWYPPVWSLGSQLDCSLVDVPEGTQAYYKILNLFHESLPETKVEIISIEQIQNLLHWDKFQRHKSYMLNQHPKTKEPLEQHLFHGTTKEAAEDICHNNFDPRMAGLNGASYGYGSYFACTAAFSNSYSAKVGPNDVRHMFLAKVLVGKVSVGRNGYRRPPPLSSKTKQYCLYDTCVDNLEKPTMFVVFDSCQCYPYYLIKYKDLPRVVDMAQ